MAFARSVLRSTTAFRNADSKVSATEAKTSRSAFSLPKQNTPLSSRIFRSPVELSCCVEPLMPMHTVTSSALLISMLSLTRRGYGLLPEGS